MMPDKSRRFARNAALQACIQIALLGGLVFWFQGGIWIPAKDPAKNEALRPRSDFMSFYASGLLIRETPHELYNAEAQARAQKTATGLDISAADIDFLPFGYPPIVALLFAPLTFLKYADAFYLMALLNIVLIGAVVWILAGRLDLEQEQAQLFGICASALISVYAVLVQGQLSILILLLYALIITDLQNGFMRRAGIRSGFLILKPTLLPVLLFWFALRRYWRALGWSLGVIALLAAVSVLLTGFEGTSAYLQMSLRMTRGDFYTTRSDDMQNLKAIVDFWNWGDRVWFFGLAAILGALAWPKKAVVARWDHCAMLLAVILAAPHLKIQDLVLILIIVALALAGTKRISPSRQRMLFLLILLPAAVEFTMSGPNGLYWPILPLATIGFYGYFLWRSAQPEESKTEKLKTEFPS